MGRISQIMPQVKVDRPLAGDCAVVALEKVLGLPYQECYEFLRDKAGFVTGCGTRGDRLEAALQSLGFTQVKTSPRTTLRSLVPLIRSGRWYVIIREHAFAVVNGVIYDTRVYRRSPYVETLWKYPD